MIEFTIPLPRPVPTVLAVGAFLKTAVCMTHGDVAHVSPPVGDLDSREAVARFEEAVARLRAAVGADPVLVAHDLHPDFASTRWAQASGLPSLPVQHHHAHIAAVAAEHGLDAPLIGLALDGFGLGPGNQAWGGELLLVDGPRYERLGGLRPLPQPGGDVAAREPWRMAAAALHALGRGGEIATRFAAHRPAALLAQVIGKGVNCPPTSSCGRLFDAACGLLGVVPVAAFEGEAPMALEKMVGAPKVMDGGWRIGPDGELDTLPLLERLIGMAPAEGADLFHGTLVAALADWAAAAAERHGPRHVGLGGGCFFNRVLSDGLTRALAQRGLTPLPARRVSPGDPGLSLGQAWIAALAAEGG